MTIIERVARAVKAHFDIRYGQETPVSDAEANIVARAVIEAMDDCPVTAKMVEAGARLLMDYAQLGPYSADSLAREAFASMRRVELQELRQAQEGRQER